MNRSALSTLLVAVALFATSAHAIQPLSAEALAGYCDRVVEEPESDESWQCIVYVKGFLDGAIATDARVAENVASEIDNQESFTERAIRTRVIKRMERMGPSVYAEFCVGLPVPIEDVVRHVAEELDEQKPLDGTYAQTIVYKALREHYPCTEPD